jgi:hypothetical protein
MARRNTPFQVKKVKQLALVAALPTHHGKPPLPNPSSRRNHCSPKITSPFSTASTHSGHLLVAFRDRPLTALCHSR